MLVLSRTVGEEIVIDGGIIVKVLKLNGNRVHIGLAAPEGTHIRRGELEERSSTRIAPK
jgi:carbon storage regulator